MSKRSDLGAWGEAAHALGIDHTSLLRAPGTRRFAEEAHRVHEVRRAAHGRIQELETLLASARLQYDLATAEGLDVLEELRAELGRQSLVLQSALAGLERSLDEQAAGGAEEPGELTSRDELVLRHGLEHQFEGLLDLLTMQGLYNPRSRTVQIQGPGNGPPQPMPPFERIIESLLTDNMIRYLGAADDLQLLLTPVADTRVLGRVGKDIGFSDYTEVTSEDRGSVNEFVDRLTTTEGLPAVDHLLHATPVPGLAAALYPRYRGGKDLEVEGTGLSVAETGQRMLGQASEAAQAGVKARPMSPPEYMMLQALRQRDGASALDDAEASGHGTETWFPGYRLADAPGTVVSRRMGHSVRFRLDQVGRGAENRGYRMTYAPAY